MQSVPDAWKKVKLRNILSVPLMNGLFKTKDLYGSGVRLVNVYDLYQDTEINISSLDRVMVSDAELARYQVVQGDIFFCRSSLKPEGVAWTSYIREIEEPAVFECHLVRAKPNTERVLPAFLSYYCRSTFARSYLMAKATVTTMATIDQTAIEELPVSLPPIEVQARMIAEMETARVARKLKLAEADALLAGIDGFLLEKLGLAALEEDNRQVFAVRLKQIRNRRIDPPSYRPYFKSGVQITTPLKSLGDIADIDSNPTTPPSNDETLVPYVGLPECDLNEVREVALRPYKEVRGRSVVKPGNILFARIEPSVFNRKYVFADDLKGHDQAYTSTEFYVVRGKEGVVEQGYLYAMFFCSFVFTQVKGKTTGSSGRRRIDPEMFASLQIPLPDMALQKSIAAEITRCRDEARRLKTEAAKEWEAAKVVFERQLLGG